MPQQPFNRLKNGLLDLMPRPVAESIYEIRHKEIWVKTKIFENEYLDIAVPSRSKDAMFYENELGVRLWLKERLRPDDVFFDVGCCFGYYPALVTYLNPAVEIHCFEPTWRHTMFIKRNAAKHQNKANPWVLVEKIVGENRKRKNTSLDAYCLKIRKVPTLVKMDIDGGEFDALKGAEKIIAGRKTEFLIELHPNILIKGGIILDQILALFPGYRSRFLPQVRTDHVAWHDSPDAIRSDDNPYAYFAPPEISRFYT